ncbi:hypothetical protein [Nocardia sp. NPDC003345]
MTGADIDGSALEMVLVRSRSLDGMTRDAAVFDLAAFIHNDRVSTRLREMLDDDIVTMQVDAADVLARAGGVQGLFVVLDEIGRRRDDPDADYIANRLCELDASGDVEILARIEPVSRELSDAGRIGFYQLKRPRGAG